MTGLLKTLLRPLRNLVVSSSPPETAQTREEREIERNVARMRGFTYLKSMDEVLTWDEHEEEGRQRASLPLIRRPGSVSRGGGEESKRAKTMVIHDFGMAYHEYESSDRVVEIEAEDLPFALDSGQLQFCERFIYFAHYLVSCPPPGWIEWCHVNGVECLGTFIIEPQTSQGEMARIFERDERGGFVVAGVLGRMARWVGFEGWIVNIEGTFGEEDWEVGSVVGFLEELKGYDAVTITNRISHQNALTPANLPFVLASSAFLTNYTWNPSSISSSLSLAHQHDLDSQNIFFGIDIWAQNRPHSFLHPRLTWPLFNGGGTNTGFAVKKCAEMGVSAGLFAPGWCWEHFSSTADRRKVEGSLWRGVELDESVKCDCKPGFWGGDVHRTWEYLGNGVTRWAEQSVVGSESGFWTVFERAFGVVANENGEKSIISQLAAQGIMPVRGEIGEKKDIWWTINDEKPGILSVVAAASSDEETGQRYLKLYNLGVRVEEDTRLVVRYHRPHSSLPKSISFLLKIHVSSGETEELIPLPGADYKEDALCHTFSPTPSHDATITELGIVFSGNLAAEQDILQLTSLSIGSPTSFPRTSSIRITDVQIAICSREKWKHGRLSWSLSSFAEEPSRTDYWSRITGPIAYFEIRIDGAMIGRACGLNFVLPDVIVERWRSDGVAVDLCGVLFGGSRSERKRVWLGEAVISSLRTPL
ncbi:glycoside hydrolase family protein [Venturia nashicola]|nr:glycoside hydrolase family protein [Venturia nashicola]